MYRKHACLLGNLPIHKNGPNHGTLDRKQAARILGVSDKALHKGYNNWCQTFRKEGSTLTLEQYFKKLDEAGITIFDLGNRSGKYQLARYNDEGPYTNESCRFIGMEANLAEAKRIPPFEAMVRKYGYEGACEINRKTGFAGKGRKLKPLTEAQRLNKSIAAKAVWARRKAQEMEQDSKRGHGYVTRATKGQDF